MQGDLGFEEKRHIRKSIEMTGKDKVESTLSTMRTKGRTTGTTSRKDKEHGSCVAPNKRCGGDHKLN